jgi:hypothetical protein
MTMDSEIEEWNRARIEDILDSSGHRTFLRIAGILTVICAGYIIQDVVKDAGRRKATKNRIILLMSVCDFLNQLFHSVIGSAMVPKDTGVPGAAGNQISCDVQGFVAYVGGAASGLYNVSLAICYLLMVRYRYTDEQLRKLEPYFLYPPIIMCLLMSIAGLPFQIYNFGGNLTCFIGASPIDCNNIESPVECERGKMYMYWNYANAVVIFLAACTISFCMIKIYLAVLQQDRSGDWFRFPASSNTISSSTNGISSRATTRANNNVNDRHSNANPSRELSNMIRMQGLWYSVAFFLSFFPLMLYFIWKITAFYLLAFFTFNLIGFTNAVIYIRPRFLKFRRDHPTVGIGSSIWHTIARTRPAPGGTTNSRSAISSSSSLWVSLKTFLSRMKSIITRRASIDTPSGVQHDETDLVTTEQDEGIAKPNNRNSNNSKKGEQESALGVEHSECNQEQVVVVDEGGFEKDECQQYSVDQGGDGDLEAVLETKTDITGIQKHEDEKETS